MVKSYHLAQCRPISVWNWTERSRTVITLKHCAKTIHARFAADAICGFRMERWCHDIAHSCLVSDLFDCWVGYCALAWCRSVHTRLIDGVLNDALRIVTGCLRPTPTDNLPALSDIQPAELRRQGATLSLANCSSLDPGLILHGQVTGPRAASKERLKSRRPFVPAAWKLLHNLSELGIRAAQWTNLTWDTEYSKSMSALGVYIPRVITRPIEMSLTRTAWVKLNRLRTGVGRFGSSMHKWGLAPWAKCECGASEQTVDHIILTSPTHRAPQGIMDLTVLNDESRCWLNSITASDLGDTAGWGGKRINPRSQSICCVWPGS